MRIKGGNLIGLAIILLFLAGFFVFGKKVSADKNAIIINEFLTNPNGSDDSEEWIELYNNSNSDINLSGWELDPDSGSYVDLGEKIIKSKGFYINGLRNNHGQISLYNSGHDEENLIDYIQYGSWDIGENENKIRDKAINNKIWTENDFTSNPKEGESLELKNDGEDNNNSSDWQESYAEGGTPGEENSTPPEPKNYPSGIYINEILPNPKGSDEETKGEYIEIYNSTEQDLELKDWQLKNASGKKYVFKDGGIVKTKEYLTVYHEDLYFPIRNNNEKIYLSDPNEKIISEVSFSDSAKENISYNFDGSSWRWSKFLTPEKENAFNNLPRYEIKKDSKFYKDIYANFSVKVRDKDKDETKVVWDFGDGHKSYKKEARHKYAGAGKYLVKLKISDGSEDIVKEFKIKVEKFPERKVKIISLSPNPEGKDSENEWIKIQNNSKKEVDLKNWSVATGWKKLYNHPINDTFVLAPEESKMLTRDICAFTLANTKDKVELRYPNGKSASSVKYKKDKIEENEVYEKINSAWIWKKYENAEIELPTESFQGPTSEELNTEEAQLEDAALNEEETIKTDIDISEFEMQEGLGKFSATADWEMKRKNKIILLSYNTHIPMPEYLYKNQIRGQVAGASTEKIDLPNPKNDSFKNFWLDLNSRINRIINSY